MNATETEIFLWVVFGVPAIICIIYVIYVMISSMYYSIAEIIKERRERKKEKKKMTIQEIISNLVKNRWSYGDIAKQAGVSKATISRWHKGTVKANKTLEEIVEKNLKDYVDRDKFDDQAGTLSYSFPSWDEVEKTIFTDDYYKKAISYHKRVIEELEKSRRTKKWRFTEDEKVILRNLPEDIKYICRDSYGLKVSECKPYRDELPKKGWYLWHIPVAGLSETLPFEHLFVCVQVNDTEPCEFRKFI